MIDRFRRGTFDDCFEAWIPSQGSPGRVKPQRGLGEREGAVRSGQQTLDARHRALAFAHLRFDCREQFLHPRTEDRIFLGWNKRHGAGTLAESSLFVSESRFREGQIDGHKRTIRLLLLEFFDPCFGREIGLPGAVVISG